MNWRLDWCLLATGLISFGLTLIQRGRGDLLRLLADDGDQGGGLLGGGVSLVVPFALLAAFLGRLGWRVVTKTWK